MMKMIGSWECIFGIVVILVLCIFATKSPTKKSSEPYIDVRSIEKLLHKGAQLTLKANDEQQTKLQAVVYASEAVGYVKALQEIASEEELNKHIDFADFRDRILETQQLRIRKMSDSNGA